MNVFVDGLIFGRQRRGGISRMWEELLKRMPGLGIHVRLLVPWRRKNDSLRRILAQSEGTLETAHDFFYWPARIFERSGVRSRILNSLFLDDGVDVFQSTYFSTVQRKNVKNVVAVYDMILELCIQESPQKWVRFGIGNKKRALEGADAVIAISEATKQDILRVYPRLAKEKITVIPLAATLEAPGSGMPFRELAAKRGWNVQTGEYILYVGLRGGYKNFSLLSRMLSMERIPDLLFLCVGGEDSGKDRLELAQLGLERHFMFMDRVEDDELRALYRNARALVFPSRREGFGLPILEAMANDCPVLCADTAVFREVGGNAPFYFDPESPASLSWALQNLATCDRETIRLRGRQNAGRFSWDDSACALARLYRGLGAGD